MSPELLYSVNLKETPAFQFDTALTMDTTYKGTLITTWDADPAEGDQTGEEIFFMDWMNETDENGNLIQINRPTVTVENVATLTNETGVIVEPASVNIRKNPTTNEYVDADITNKTITVTIPGKAFTGTEERWIEIKQGATITKAKYKIEGNNVTEQPWARKTILTVTDDFSGYTKDIPATINIYLTATATKAVATATVKVIDMPFKLVFFKTDHLGTPRVITDQDGNVVSTHDYLAYGEEITTADFQTNRMKFTGHERDPETGLDYMLARYYSSGGGRMLQVDPIDDYDFTDPMSFNKYSYVRCNPIMGTDPTGMAEQKSRMRQLFEADSGLWNIHHWGGENPEHSNISTTGDTPGDYAASVMSDGITALGKPATTAVEKGIEVADKTRPTRDTISDSLQPVEEVLGDSADWMLDLAVIAYAFPEPATTIGGAPFCLAVSESLSAGELTVAVVRAFVVVESDEGWKNAGAKGIKFAGGRVVGAIAKMWNLSKAFVGFVYSHTLKAVDQTNQGDQ